MKRIQINKAFCENGCVVSEQVYKAICDDDVYSLLSRYRWAYIAGYAIKSSNPHKGIAMHTIVMSPPPGVVVHHKNGNKLDNRRCNLICVSRSEHIRIHKSRSAAYHSTEGSGSHKRFNLIFFGAMFHKFPKHRRIHDSLESALKTAHAVHAKMRKQGLLTECHPAIVLGPDCGRGGKVINSEISPSPLPD